MNRPKGIEVAIAASTASARARREAWVREMEHAVAEGRTLESVATELGFRPESVAHRLHRAGRADLAEALQGDTSRAARDAAFVEDAEWMARTGETADGAAERFGIADRHSLRDRLSDLGRSDLWEALKDNATTGTGVRAGRITGRRAAA